MNAPTDKGTADRRNGGRGTILYLSVLVVGVLAAWQVREFLKPGRGGHGPVTMDTGATTQPRLMDDWALGSVDAAADPNLSAGWTATEDDPLGLHPPAGAKRLKALRNADGSMQARYSFPGEIAAAAEHYRNALREGGFHVLSDRPDQFGWHRLVFVDNNRGTYATVALHGERRDAKMVTVEVSVFPRAGTH